MLGTGIGFEFAESKTWYDDDSEIGRRGRYEATTNGAALEVLKTT
jgi:hypothetical protein